MIKVHQHTGWNNDDSDHYDGYDTIIDLEDNTVEVTHEIEGWSSNGGHYGPSIEIKSRNFIYPTWNDQEIIHNLLTPFINMVKNTNRKAFNIASRKQYYFFTDKWIKAVSKAQTSDCYQKDNLQSVFILPNYGISITIFIDIYHKQYIKVDIQPIHYWQLEEEGWSE